MDNKTLKMRIKLGSVDVQTLIIAARKRAAKLNVETLHIPFPYKYDR